MSKPLSMCAPSYHQDGRDFEFPPLATRPADACICCWDGCPGDSHHRTYEPAVEVTSGRMYCGWCWRDHNARQPQNAPASHADRLGLAS